MAAQPGDSRGSRQSVSAQGRALAQRTDGNVGTLRPRYFTPCEGALPVPNNRVIAGQHHEPLSIALTAKSGLSRSEEGRLKIGLDGFFLLESAGMSLPDDVRQVGIPDRSLSGVVEEDFQFFTGLIALDVSENYLELAPFGSLPRLKELRIACNSIQKIEELYGFDYLVYLDLSYNKLTVRSVQSLDVLHNLKDLDLSGNNLRGLPKEMYRFRMLERLVIDNNKMDDNIVFSILCTVPNLRLLSAAHNYLWRFPLECCSDGYFRVLSTLDISFNYFGSEGDVQPIADLPRLTTVMLYGNPVLGPKGEDPTFIYIEELVNAASAIRLGSNRHEIDWVTEVPRNRSFKKGIPAGRKATYRDFSIVNVKADFDSATATTQQPHSAHEWREAGNQTLFAEAIAIARKEQMNARDNDLTFITASHPNTEDEELAKSIADNVMDRVAGEMGLRSSAELLQMRDCLKPGRTSATLEYEFDERHRANQQHQFFPLRTYSISNEPSLPAGNENTSGAAATFESLPQQHVDNNIQDKLPSTLFGRSMGDPHTLVTHPVAVKTALRALQFALRHPLTNYTEVPAKGLLPPKDYVRPTLSSINRKLPHRELRESTVSRTKAHDDLQAKRDSLKGLPEPFAIAHSRKIARDSTQQQIELVLDSLNNYSDNILNKKTSMGTTTEQIEHMKGFARPTTGLRSLVKMVDQVVKDLE